MNNNDPQTDLKGALERLGAREYEIVALSMDVHRGLAALAYAEQRGVDHPISYAIKVFDNPDWQPAAEKRRVATNQSVDRTCSHCGGARFVTVTAGLELYEDTYAPCKACNASANTKRWVGDEPRETVPR